MFALALKANAATPKAAIVSAEMFSLNGHPMAAPGVTFWPLTYGDRMQTANAAAVIVFDDGSRVKIAPNSSGRLEIAEGRPKVILTGGTLDFKLVLGSGVFVTSLDLEKKHVPPPPIAYGSPTRSTSTAGDLRFELPTGPLVVLPPLNRKY